jgi:hypothetical protein
MKIFSKVKTTFVNGTEVNFVNNVAEVSEAIGKELLGRAGNLYQEMKKDGKKVLTYTESSIERLEQEYQLLKADLPKLPILRAWFNQKSPEVQQALLTYQQSGIPAASTAIPGAPPSGRGPAAQPEFTTEAGNGLGGEAVIGVDGIQTPVQPVGAVKNVGKPGIVERAQAALNKKV